MLERSETGCASHGPHSLPGSAAAERWSEECGQPAIGDTKKACVGRYSRSHAWKVHHEVFSCQGIFCCLVSAALFTSYAVPAIVEM